MRGVSSAELQAATDAARGDGAGVGFVPTMGAHSAGRRSLLARARAENGFVVASVFVNPLQFGPAEDLASLPRDREADLAVLAAEGVDLAFLPSEREMWPSPPEVRLQVGGLAERLEGLVRPGHLDGVAHGGGQAVAPGRAVAGLLRPEGRPAAGGGRADGRRPGLPQPDRGLPDGAGAGRAGGSNARNAYLLPDERQHHPVPGPGGGSGRVRVRRARPGNRGGGRPRGAGGRSRGRARLRGLVDPATFEPVKQAEAGQVLATAAGSGLRTRLMF